MKDKNRKGTLIRCGECGKPATFECAECGEMFCKKCAEENYEECPVCEPHLFEVGRKYEIVTYKDGVKYTKRGKL